MRRDESVVGWLPLEGGGLSVLGIRKLELESRDTRQPPAATSLVSVNMAQQSNLPGLPGLSAQIGLSGQLGQVGIELASRAEPEPTIAETPAELVNSSTTAAGEMFVIEGRRISDNQVFETEYN